MGVGYDKEHEKPLSERKAPVDSLVIPSEVLDLLRFICSTWTEIDKWAYENMDGDALGKYPVIQGTSNQIALQHIGEQPYNTANIRAGVEWMLSQKG